MKKTILTVVMIGTLMSCNSPSSLGQQVAQLQCDLTEIQTTNPIKAIELVGKVSKIQEKVDKLNKKEKKEYNKAYYKALRACKK